MQKIFFLMLFLLSSVAGATIAQVLPNNSKSLLLTWDHYNDATLPTSVTYDATNYNIEAQCKINNGPYDITASTPAANDSLRVTVNATPGNIIGCQIRAMRLSDNTPSPWLAEVQIISPLLEPTTPLNLQLNFQ